MKYQQDRAWMEISLDAIEENYRKIQSTIGEERSIIAVVKADAYGLGALTISRVLEDLHCPMLAVACIEEAMELRDGGIKTEILLLGPVNPEHVKIVAENNITVPIISLDSAKRLSQYAEENNVTVNVHIKADSGLARFGLMLSDMETALSQSEEIFALPGLNVKGVFTHYTAADIPMGEEFNRAQIALFDAYCQSLYDRGHEFMKHSASSFFTEIYPESYNDGVRVAGILLGLEEPAIRGMVCTQSTSLKTRIYQVKDLPMGVPISYGPWFYTLRPTKIAVIPLGFADGIRRTIQCGKASYMIRGKWAPIIGKMCMDYTMLDITDIPEAEPGDIVTVFGRDGELCQEAYELGRLYPGTVGEVVSAISARVPRFYIRGGEIVDI